MFKIKVVTMWKPSSLFLLHTLFFLAIVSAKSNISQWNTLNGNPPLIIAHGGFSGIFPHSSINAYNFALETSVPDVALWCDVQLTKDQVGICFPSLNLDESTIPYKFQNPNTTYLVNGVPTSGYFSVDYTFKDISDVYLIQDINSRSQLFDGIYPILSVVEVAKLAATKTQTRGLWLNIQHDTFYKQHNLSMTSFVLSVSRRVRINHISSPEVGFLRSIKPRFDPKTTKLVFRFLNQNDTDPSTNQTYGSLLKNLTFIKTFASGILVPKGYIWPVDASRYLQPHTSLVSDAHKLGLEVFASDFANDALLSFNYSYDPLVEYLQFIDNGNFSVDGMLSDFPATPSEAIGCFAHLGTNATKRDKTLIISKFGASGDYPACTDLAYNQALFDGVDILDCPVQMSKDGVPFCLSSIDLMESTTVAQSSFNNLAMSIPEIKSERGIFTFNLTWADIQGLNPSILNPYPKYTLFRNPKYKNAGKFVTLSDFLYLTKKLTSPTGIMIIVENAVYLAEKQGFSVTDVVIDALSKAGYDKPGSQKVYIQSTNSSVLLKFKEKTNYELVYKIDETISDASDAAIEDIKSFAGYVIINKDSVFPRNEAFLTSSTTSIVPKLKASNLSVFVETFSNEFVSQAWDFFSDSTAEINSFIQVAEIDGIITDYPKTANRYTRNKCLNLGDKKPDYMRPVQVGSLYGIISTDSKPPAVAPLPPLTKAEVVEPPLPTVIVTKIAPASSPAAGTKSPPGNAQAKVSVCFFLSSLSVFVASLILL